MRWREWLGVGERRWKKAPDEEVQPAKTLWDWLGLLIVPAILIGVTFAWSASQTRSDNKREDRRIDAERAAAEVARQDATLQAYFDEMSGLMLDRKLLTSKEGDAVRAVARTVTLTALRRLDGERKGEVVRFLAEAELLGIENPRVDLDAADLTSANLKDANLSDLDFDGANLAGANLAGAFLDQSVLESANLGGANLARASLWETDLQGANLEGANLAFADLDGVVLDFANFADADLRGALLASANLRRAKNLDLDRFINNELPPELAQKFIDGQWDYLVSLPPAELATFNLSQEKLAELRREIGPRRPRRPAPPAPLAPAAEGTIG